MRPLRRNPPASLRLPLPKPLLRPPHMLLQRSRPRPCPLRGIRPWLRSFKRQYGSGIEPLTYLGQNYMVVDRSLIPEILQILRNEEQFDYCVDITAVHYPKREKQFDVVWVLYSFRATSASA
jgi:hypothetical protein